MHSKSINKINNKILNINQFHILGDSQNKKYSTTVNSKNNSSSKKKFKIKYNDNNQDDNLFFSNINLINKNYNNYLSGKNSNKNILLNFIKEKDHFIHRNNLYDSSKNISYKSFINKYKNRNKTFLPDKNKNKNKSISNIHHIEINNNKGGTQNSICKDNNKNILYNKENSTDINNNFILERNNSRSIYNNQHNKNGNIKLLKDVIRSSSNNDNCNKTTSITNKKSYISYIINSNNKDISKQSDSTSIIKVNCKFNNKKEDKEKEKEKEKLNNISKNNDNIQKILENKNSINERIFKSDERNNNIEDLKNIINIENNNKINNINQIEKDIENKNLLFENQNKNENMEKKVNEHIIFDENNPEMKIDDIGLNDKDIMNNISKNRKDKNKISEKEKESIDKEKRIEKKNNLNNDSLIDKENKIGKKIINSNINSLIDKDNKDKNKYNESPFQNIKANNANLNELDNIIENYDLNKNNNEINNQLNSSENNYIKLKINNYQNDLNKNSKKSDEIKEEINNNDNMENNFNNDIINEESSKNNIYNKNINELENIPTQIKPQESDNYFNHIITTDFGKENNINKEEDKKNNNDNIIQKFTNKNNYEDYPELLCNINKNKKNENNKLKEDEKSILTTQSRDCLYYQNELTKLSSYIKKYYSENNSYPQSNIEFYLFGREIGHGAFGKVNLCLHIASGHLVAMKTFVKKDLKYKETKEKLKNEVEVLSKLHHPFINQILDSFETETHFFIVMEYVCGDLLSFIRKRNKLNEPSAKIIFKQIIEGLKYIHKKKIIHRDIKLDNILIDLSNTIKICDFGVSRKIDKGNLIYERCGTPAYIAPEIYAKIGYDGGQCDIWSAGVTLYYILTGTLPFRGGNIHELEKVILSGEYERIKNVSDEANDIISGMLKVDPNKRLTIDEILKHPWLNNIKLENRYKLHIFTEAEKKLLCKYDVDYLNSSKGDLIENFTYRNLAIDNNQKKISGNTKSVIYAPYNSCVNEDSKDEEDINIISYLNKEEKALYEELEINNNICKFGWRVKQANINYELSNNDDFDNGLIKSIKEEEYKNKNEKIDNNADNSNKNKSLESVKDYEKIKINKNILEYIENNVGYDKKYLTKCLKKNIINYSTATYYLLYKNKMDNKS